MTNKMEEKDGLKDEIEQLKEFINNQKRMYEHRIDLQIRQYDRLKEKTEKTERKTERQLRELMQKNQEKAFKIDEITSKNSILKTELEQLKEKVAPCKTWAEVIINLTRLYNGNGHGHGLTTGVVADVSPIIRIERSFKRYTELLLSDFDKTIFLKEEEE